MKYEQWLNEWLNLYVKPATKPRTYEKYTRQIKAHVLPILGGFELKDLTALVLQRFTVSLSNKGLSVNTINGIVSLLKASLRCAVQVSTIDREFSHAIVRPKGNEKQVDCLTKDEQKRIERYIAEKRNGRLFGIILTLYTGVRIGELLALTWNDIDLSKGIMTVSKSCRDSWNNRAYIKIIDSPKTESSVRIIPIPKQLLPHLRALKKKSKNVYLVGGRGDCGSGIRSYQNTFELLLKRLKIQHKGFHSLRHTFATRALECGMDIKSLAEILGHKNPTVTLKRYAHSMLEHKAAMMNKIGKLLL